MICGEILLPKQFNEATAILAAMLLTLALKRWQPKRQIPRQRSNDPMLAAAGLKG